MDKTVLFKTVHGSHLYGLAHENSDNDTYTVLDKVKNRKARYAKQRISGEDDSMVVDFGTWLDMCRSGVPQACEAMFSTQPLVDTIAEFRAGYRIGTGALERYLRTITNFCMTPGPQA
jgi:predicted nucleotidyltransferase